MKILPNYLILLLLSILPLLKNRVNKVSFLAFNITFPDSSDQQEMKEARKPLFFFELRENRRKNGRIQ